MLLIYINLSDFYVISNNNDIFEIKIFLFIENLARILYSREGVQCTGAGRRGSRGL